LWRQLAGAIIVKRQGKFARAFARAASSMHRFRRSRAFLCSISIEKDKAMKTFFLCGWIRTRPTRLFRLSLALAATLLVILCSSIPLSAAPLLAIDFDQNDPGINPGNDLITQPGFTSMSGVVLEPGTAPLTAASQTIGPYSVTVSYPVVDSSLQGFFYRGGLTNSGSFTYANLYNDFVYTNGAPGLDPTIHFSISGVTPNKLYALTFYSYDNVLNSALSETSTFTPIDNTTGGTGMVTYAPGTVLTSNSEFSTTIYVSSTTNTLDISASANNQVEASDGLRVNGFTLSDVPEPSSLAALVGLAATGLILVARRHGR
jgi:hypothetical protein